MSKIKQQTRSFKDLLYVAKVVQKESMLEGFLSASTGQKEKYIKEIEKNKNYTQRYSYFIKIFSSIYIIIAALVSSESYFALLNVINFVNPLNFSAFLFIISLSMAIILTIQFVFMFTYGMTSLVGIFTENHTFKYLSTLPFTQKEKEKIMLITFIKTLDLQLLTILLAFPIITAIITHSIIITIIAFIMSVINVFITISLMVFVSNFMIRKVYSVEATSKAQSIGKLLISLVYIALISSMGLMFSFFGDLVVNLFSSFQNGNELFVYLNALLIFLPFPFSMTYLFGISFFIPNHLYWNQIWPMIFGFIFSIYITIRLFKKGMKFLADSTKEIEGKGKHGEGKKDIMEKEIEFEKRGPVKAIIIKDLLFCVRDFGNSMYLIIPIFLPIISSFLISVGQSDDLIESLYYSSLTRLLYMIMSVIFLTMAVTNSENETGNLINTLPIRNSDIFRAKRKFMVIIMIIASVVAYLLQLILYPKAYIFLFGVELTTLIIGITSINTILVLYSVLFGKVKNLYTIQKINLKYQIIKSVVGVIILLIIIVLPWIIGLIVLITEFNGDFNIIIYQLNLLISIVLLIISEVVARKIFYRD